MLLDVSMCLVVLFSDFGINTNPNSVSEDLFRPTTSYNTCRRPFSSSFGTKEKNHYCAAARSDHFQASGRRISATTVRNRLHNAGLYAEDRLCAFPSTDDSEGTAYAGQENMFLGRSNNGLLCCSQTSQIYNGE
ncbi:uncharacterized protein TNCV_955482 [Trichonephila clavipes]|nr:uncharacterized protein TNCV_955482 [Trichonephila clavipes]